MIHRYLFRFSFPTSLPIFSNQNCPGRHSKTGCHADAARYQAKGVLICPYQKKPYLTVSRTRKNHGRSWCPHLEIFSVINWSCGGDSRMRKALSQNPKRALGFHLCYDATHHILVSLKDHRGLGIYPLPVPNIVRTYPALL